MTSLSPLVHGRGDGLDYFALTGCQVISSSISRSLFSYPAASGALKSLTLMRCEASKAEANRKLVSDGPPKPSARQNQPRRCSAGMRSLCFPRRLSHGAGDASDSAGRDIPKKSSTPNVGPGRLKNQEKLNKKLRRKQEYVSTAPERDRSMWQQGNNHNKAECGPGR